MLAADLAEMLSSDMQKEGLSGRTLTLKLKTASFELRTRAVTLQKYICTNEDILKYASKLLKAELPVSLRLIGLRLSQFNEGKAGAPSEATQKNLTNFLILGDASRKSISDDSSLASISDGREMSSYDGRDLLDCNPLPELEDNHTIGNADGMEKNYEPSNNEAAIEVNTPDTKSHQNAVSGLLEADLSSMAPACSILDEVNKRLDDKAASSSNQGLLWINDYKCSLCGFELPPGFVEERQEHSDFHLAERLQEEESRNETSPVMPRHSRFPQKDNIPSQSNRKRQKISPKDKGHIPIDLFFVKSCQNF